MEPRTLISEKLSPEEASMKAPRGGPRLVVAHGNAGYVEQVSRLFRQRGWEVHPARSGPEARRLARLHRPAAVVLEADAKDESGWLTCAKLIREPVACKVVLVSRGPGCANYRLARFVGSAALVAQDDGARALLNEVEEAVQLPAVG
jgi:CheY-like chemotaxis protein